MTKTPFALLLSASVFLPTLAAAAPRCDDLKVPAAPASFDAFRAAVAGSLRQAGDEATAAQVEALAPERAVPAKDAALASCLLRRYTVARYGDRIVSDLQEMVAFRTFAEEGKENWGLPEFARQRDWLRSKAEGLGLAFKDYDGRMDEITLPGGPAPILAVLTHGDVQDVQGQQWASPPWEAKIVDGRIIGRGTEDDKGPIVASLYSMAALRDTGWPLGMTVRLLVANGEESSWDEIPYYLERAPKPDMTFGIDAAYPVVHAQKGFGVLTLSSKGAEKPKKAEWWIVQMAGGSGMSIIPERGEAVLETSRYPEGALTDLKRRAAEWSAAHPPARLTVTHEPGDRFRVVAEGKGGHSSEPKSGHNALADLAAFLSTLNLRMDARGALVSFVASTVSTETDGRSLGVATHDEGIGDLTVNLSFLRDKEGVPVAEINLRVPRGISNEEVQRRVAEKAAAFRQRSGAAIEVESKRMSEPHWAPPEGKLVASLLGVWEEVTGKPGKPIAIGGGTQARLFLGGVDFGPALEMDHYRGHGTDEYLTVDELHRIAELTVAAFWRLASPAGTF